MAPESPDPRLEPAALLARLEQLEQSLAALQERLRAMEGRPHPAVPPPPPPLERVRRTPAPPAAPVATPPMRRPVPAPVPHERPVPRPRGDTPEGWETEIALKWMGRVGAVALIFAVGYFLQYAFVNHLIGPTGQVAIGLLAGMVLLVLGEVNLRRQRRPLGEALLGGGIALLYVSVFAAYAFYRPPLLGYSAAFAFLVVVTGLAVALSLRAEAQSTAVLAALGGYLTPILLHRAGSGSSQLNSLIQLFTYLTILDMGLLALTFYRRWRALQVLAFVGSWLILWGWLDSVTDQTLRYYTIGPALVLFLIFVLVPVIRNLRMKRSTQPEELGLILANPACFFPTLAVLAAIYYPDYLGLLAVGLGALYLGLGLTAYRRNPEDRLLSLSWLSLGLALVTVAVPLQFQGEWIMLAWGLEGALLIWIGVKLESLAIRVLGVGLQLVVGGWLVVLYEVSDLPREHLLAFLNPLFLSYLGGMLTLGAGAWVYARSRVPDPERQPLVNVLAAFLGVHLVLLGTFEMSRLNLPTHLHLAWWAVAATPIMAVGVTCRRLPLRVLGLALQAVVVVWLLLLYSLDPTPVWWHVYVPVVNELSLTFILGLASLGVSLALYVRAGGETPERRQAAPVLAVVLALLGLWGLTAEVARGLGEWAREATSLRGIVGFAISLAWCLYAAALASYGIARRYRALRAVGLGIFALAVLKVFAWDSQELERLWRILSFVALGVILIAVSYLYHLHGERIRALLAGDTPLARPEEEADDTPPDGPG